MKIAIIGAGITGLSAAYDLAKVGHHVTMFESASKPGGLAAGFKSARWEWHLEHFYHHWFETDDDILGLIKEIGVRDKVFFPQPTTSMYINGQIYPLDSPLRAILFPKLSLIPKLRFGLAGLYLRLTEDWRALEKVTAHEWLTRMMGQTAYQTLWEPLLVGKFGDYYKEVNMAWFWARIHKRSQRLGYFEGGFQAFIDALTETVRAYQVRLHFNTNITAIEPQANGQLQIRTHADDTQIFDQILATVSPDLLSQLVPTLPTNYLASLKRLESMGAVVLTLALQQSLTSRHYWINIPKKEGFPFLALVEHTNYVNSRYYDNDHIVYCGDYLKPNHEYFSLSKDELLARFLPSLSRINPNFSPTWIKESWLYRAKYAQPIPLINHSANIPPLQTPLPGLYWASMSQVYPWDRGTNYAVEIGRRVARLMK